MGHGNALGKAALGSELSPDQFADPLNTVTDIDRLIDELVRRLRGRPILEIVTAARQIENRVSDLYLHEALRKYAADRREEPSRHVVAALRRLLAPCGF